MKLLFVIPSLGMGGAERMLENLVEFFARQGDEMTIAVFYDEKSPISERLRESGIPIICLNKKLGLDLSIPYKIRKIIKQIRPQIMHTHLYAIPYVFVAGRRIPIIHTVHSIAAKEQTRMHRILCKLIYASKRCTAVAINEKVQESLVREYRLARDEFPIINNGIDLSKCTLKTDYSIGDRIELINVSSLIPIKNHRIMLDSLKTLNSMGHAAHLTLLGDGACRDDLKQYASQTGVIGNVTFAGVVDNVFPYLTKSDIFIMPSEYEGEPMSIIEAMGTGLPIIATSIGGISSMLNNGESGVLIVPDAKTLSDNIITLSQSMRAREMLGANAYARSISYSQSKMGESYRRLYYQVLRGD